jgi:hypothetical protein
MYKKFVTTLCFLTIGSSSSFAEKNLIVNYPKEDSSLIELEPFYTLPLTDEDKVFLSQLVSDFAEKNFEELMQNQADSEKSIDRFDLIHPLRIAGFIFSEPNLKESAKEIMNTDGKSHMIVALLMVKIKKGIELGTLNQYMPGFIDYCGADKDLVSSFIDQDNYRGLINYLLELEVSY